MELLSQSYRTSLAIWDNKVLPASQHKWTHYALTAARQASTQYINPERWKADLNYDADGYIPCHGLGL